jgi:hypothetical protein
LMEIELIKAKEVAEPLLLLKLIFSLTWAMKFEHR